MSGEGVRTSRSSMKSAAREPPHPTCSLPFAVATLPHGGGEDAAARGARLTIHALACDFKFSCQTAPSHRARISRRTSSIVRARCADKANAPPPGGTGAPGVALTSFLPLAYRGERSAERRTLLSSRCSPVLARTRLRGAGRDLAVASRLPALHRRRFLSPGRASAGASRRPRAPSQQAPCGWIAYYPPGGAPGPPGLELARFQRERRTSLRLRTASRRRPSMSEATWILSAVFPTGITFFAAAANLPFRC